MIFLIIGQYCLRIEVVVSSFYFMIPVVFKLSFMLLYNHFRAIFNRALADFKLGTLQMMAGHILRRMMTAKYPPAGRKDQAQLISEC